MPGTALGPGGCHPRDRAGLSRALARTPQSPKSHWEARVGKARNEGGGPKGGSSLWRLKLMGTRQGEGPFLWSVLGDPSLLSEGLDRGNSVPNPVLSRANEGRGGSDPDRASPGANGGRGLGCCPGLTGVVGCCLGPAEA